MLGHKLLDHFNDNMAVGIGVGGRKKNIEVDFRSGETQGEVNFADQVVGGATGTGTGSGSDDDDGGGCHAIKGGADFPTSLGSWLMIVLWGLGLFIIRRRA